MSEYIPIELPKENKDNIVFESIMLIRELTETPYSPKATQMHNIDNYNLILSPIKVRTNTNVWLACFNVESKALPNSVADSDEEDEESIQNQLTPWIQSFFDLI